MKILVKLIKGILMILGILLYTYPLIIIMFVLDFRSVLLWALFWIMGYISIGFYKAIEIKEDNDNEKIHIK